MPPGISVTADVGRVLSRYPAIGPPVRLEPATGGFSGARIWRLTGPGGRTFCLKAHPPAADANRLERVIHPWMRTAREAGLDFVPQVERTADGRTVVEHAGRPWDLCQWMP